MLFFNIYFLFPMRFCTEIRDEREKEIEAISRLLEAAEKVLDLNSEQQLGTRT